MFAAKQNNICLWQIANLAAHLLWNYLDELDHENNIHRVNPDLKLTHLSVVGVVNLLQTPPYVVTHIFKTCLNIRKHFRKPRKSSRNASFVLVDVLLIISWSRKFLCEVLHYWWQHALVQIISFNPFAKGHITMLGSSPCSTKETFPQYFLVILKRTLQNY